MQLPNYLYLGSPVVPFTLFFGYGFPYKVTNPKKGALIIRWLPGCQGMGTWTLGVSLLDHAAADIRSVPDDLGSPCTCGQSHGRLNVGGLRNFAWAGLGLRVLGFRV